MVKHLSAGMLSVLLLAGPVMAQVFPIDANSTTTLTSVKADLVAWGVAFIGVALTIFAYKRVKSLVH